MSFRKVLMLAGILCAVSATAWANNLSLTNIEVGSQDASSDTLVLSFDVSWQNSWRDATNYDAAWVFVKYSTDHGASWQHATLKTAGVNPDGTDDGSGTALEMAVPTDRKGCFFQRAANGSGTLSSSGVELSWAYGDDGVSDSVALSLDTLIKVFGIEMAYVPSGGFSAGENSDGSAATSAHFEYGSASSTAPAVTGEAAFSFENVAASGWYYNSSGAAGEDASGSVFTVPAAFPKGTAGFYLMKTEITQGVYRDFLNTLSRAQQNARTASQAASRYALTDTASVSSRNGIRCPASIPAGAIAFGCDLDGDGVFDEADDGEWIACNYLSWPDVSAFAEWAALRPMTELEYEKAARGSAAPVNGEYAWGTATLTQAEAASSGGSENETASTSGTGLANYDGAGTDAGGPLRGGFAATTSTATRAAAGSGVYGHLDLTGNLWERTVTIGNTAGRNFAGTHGTGEPNAGGYAVRTDWPGYSASTPGVSGAAGAGFRGGAFNTNVTAQLSIANRALASSEDATRLAGSGGRVSRTKDF